MEKQLKIPEHIAFIMDGNGRWAAERGLSRSEGHRQGAEALKTVVNACAERGIKVVSVYAFSCETGRDASGNKVFVFTHYSICEKRT